MNENKQPKSQNVKNDHTSYTIVTDPDEKEAFFADITRADPDEEYNKLLSSYMDAIKF